MNSPLRDRLNAWVSFAQAPWPEYLRQGREGEAITMIQQPPDAGVDTQGGEYLVAPVVEGKLPVAAKIGRWVIYRVPFQSLAMAGKGTPLDLTWVTSRHIQVSGNLPNGQTLNVKVKFHPAWRATQDGQPVAISKADNGFMTLAVPAGQVKIELVYNGTPEQHFFGYLSAFAWVVSIGYVAFRASRRSDVV